MSYTGESFLRWRGFAALKDTRFGELKDKAILLSTALWAKTTRRMRYGGLFVLILAVVIIFSPRLSDVNVPTLRLEYYEPKAANFNQSKVALLIENRPFPILAPLMLHFISVVPPDWRFRFMGSKESVTAIKRSNAIREHVKSGKLDLTYIPSNMTTGSQEEISRFLTNLWLYEQVLQPAEWLLIFQTDSIICANSRMNLNDYLEYHWIGAPWHPDASWGGNGGLSLRRVSAMIEILREQVRIDNSEPEDVWLAERLAHRIGAKVANGTVSLTFSGESYIGDLVEVEDFDLNKANASAIDEAMRQNKYIKGVDDWRAGQYEPMGYHTGGSGKFLNGHIWGSPEGRRHIWNYCPEVKMTLAMDAAKFVPGECGATWKRSVQIPGAPQGVVDVGYGTEIIDDVLYPVLPPGIHPW